ncbi:MAG: hypothetical protein H0T79_13055 [Deltaproteobacteria bacterium]|nr:hypothetical protein [Deltaproteobacteria bacterium]
MSRHWLVSAAAVIVASCGSNYVYVPEGATSWSQGQPVTRIQIPPEEPKGEVRAASVGLTRLQVAGGRQPDLDVIHIRLTIHNDSDRRPWVVDTREQLLEIPGEGRSRPIFVNSDRDSMPTISIGARDKRVIDLYYPLPSTVTRESELTRFELLWQVQTGDRMIAQRTAFDRATLEAEPSYGLYAGWGPYWWHDPFYSSQFGFVHHRPISIHSPSRVIVGHRR